MKEKLEQIKKEAMKQNVATLKKWRELLQSMSWLRPGDKFDKSIQSYPRYKSTKETFSNLDLYMI